MIFTSFSPNTRFKDVLLGFCLLWQPWRWKKGKSINKVEGWFKEYFNIQNIYSFNYARSALYILFKALDLNPEDEVLIQGYTCVAAVNPIKWNGLKVQYVDIDQKSYSMDIDDFKRKISSKTKAVLFQYTYGLLGNIEEVKKITKEKGIFLIEDCANTIGSKYKGQLLGTIGDAAVFSMGRDKPVTSGDGGILAINNEKLLVKVEEHYKKLDYPQSRWLFRELVYGPIWYLIRKTFNLFKVGKLIHLITTKTGLLTRATSDLEKRGERVENIPKLLPNALASLAWQQLKDLHQFNQHRFEISKVYEKGLRGLENVKAIKIPNEVFLLRYPLLVKGRENFLQFARSRDIYLGDWYTQPIDPKEVDMEVVGYKKGLCPKAEAVCQEIVNLPTHINLSLDQAYQIVNLIKEFYGNKKS